MSETKLPSAQDLVGQTVAGRFEVKRLLGQGGMGAVYEATQQPLGRRVALKVIKRSLTDDAVAVRRFTTEAQAVSQLSHPHIVTVHDFGQSEDGKLFIAMEFLKGESVRERLQREGALPWQKTLPIIVEVCQALSAAHEQGIIHRDLKPDNVMLVQTKGRDDYVKVVDFGVAKLLEVDDSASKITSTGMAVGTPGYISPEQIDGITDDPRSDLYSLGVTWFEMLTNQSPFSGATPVKLVLEHMTKPAPRPSEVAPRAEIAPEVDRLVQRLMGKAPGARAPSVDSLIAELESLWSSAPTLPPDAATAALDTGDVDTVRAAALLPQPTPEGTPPGTPVGMAPSATPGAVVAAAGVVTPATGGVAAVAANADLVGPKKKRSALQWAGLGCLVFFVAPVSTCAMCVAVNGPPEPSITADGDDATGLHFDLSNLTKHAGGATISSQDGEVHVQLPSLGDEGANRLLEDFIRAAIDGDDTEVGRLQERLSEDATEDEKRALEIAELVLQKLRDGDAGVPNLDVVTGEPTAPDTPVVAEEPPEPPKPPAPKRGEFAKKRRKAKAKLRESGEKRREKLAEKLAEEQQARDGEEPAAEPEAKQPKKPRKARKAPKKTRRHPIDGILDSVNRSLNRNKSGSQSSE